MAQQSLKVELPEELGALLGSPEAAAARAKQALVLDLLREARISQGRAAALLVLTRRDILDLMVQYEIPSGPETAEELREEVDNLRRLLQQS
jgi:polyhydroxyalkanoate synthesis regulator phasin